MTAMIFVLTTGATAGPVSAQAPVGGAVEQLLILSNGEILRGQISRNAEQVIVVTNQGSRLVLPAERTEFVCDTLQEAYWGKAARIRASDLAGQKKLFHWCSYFRRKAPFDLVTNSCGSKKQISFPFDPIQYIILLFCTILI